MLHTEQCQQCKQVVYPPKRICPSCYSSAFKSIPDHVGQVMAQIKNTNQEHYISLIKTQHQALVFAVTEQALSIGQSVLIQDDNKKLISIPIEETDDEKDS